jgi:serine protease Do
MSRRLRAYLYGTVAALAVGAAVLQFSPAPTALVAPAHAQTTQASGPQSFADIVERVRPAVVSVKVSRPANGEQMSFRDIPGLEEGDRGAIERFMRRFGDQFGDQRFGHGERRGAPGRGPRAMAQGSGFFISADGYVVTNNHVVEGASEAELVIDGGRTVKAKVVGTDPRTDLALLKVEGGGSNYPFVRFASQAPRVGDWVLAVGNPFGLGGTVTAGIVSARGRDIGSGPYDDFLQIDAAVNRGNSGGPTFNANGEVIGVNTAIYSPSGGNVGIAFAIPAETTQTVIAALRDHGTVQRGWIGVQIQAVTDDIAESLRLPKAEGALVASIQAGSPASRSDLKPSDVITAVDGQPVKDARDLSRRIAQAHPGATVKMTVQRDGAERTVNLTLGEIPNERETARAGQPSDRRGGEETTSGQLPQLGLSLAPAARSGKFSGRGSEGLVVTEVDPSGLAAERGVREGDVILEVAGRAVSSTREVREALGAAKADGRRAALIRLRSGEGQRFVAIPLNRG